MLLVLLCRDEIEHCRRAVHSKEATHKAAQRACPQLVWQSCAEFYPFVQECKIDAYKNEDEPQYEPYCGILHYLKQADCRSGGKEENGEDWDEPFPGNEPPVFYCGNKGCCKGQ